MKFTCEEIASELVYSEEKTLRMREVRIASTEASVMSEFQEKLHHFPTPHSTSNCFSSLNIKEFK